MAIFRKVHVNFWSDPYIENLTPERKYFYLYLITNDKTTQCGIYEISKRKMVVDTGYNAETIDKLICQFENDGKVRYSLKTGEIALKNWAKYNDAASPKVKACINKELQKIKDKSLFVYMGHAEPQGSSFNSNYRVSESIRKQVFDKYNNKCQKCESTESLQIDHILPRSIGGESIIENLRCLCGSCNSARPLIGIDLVNEVNASGFSYEYLCDLQNINPYAYSMRRHSQEEEEQEEEREKEQEPKDGELELLKCLDIALKDNKWVRRNKTTSKELEVFVSKLEKEGVYYKVPIDFKSHFSRWKNKNPPELSEPKTTYIPKMPQSENRW